MDSPYHLVNEEIVLLQDAANFHKGDVFAPVSEKDLVLAQRLLERGKAALLEPEEPVVPGISVLEVPEADHDESDPAETEQEVVDNPEATPDVPDQEEQKEG